jgi:hypothetical protein
MSCQYLGQNDGILQWFGHVKRMDRARIPSRALELKFKGKRFIRKPRTRLFSWVLEDIKNRGKRWLEIKKERL